MSINRKIRNLSPFSFTAAFVLHTLNGFWCRGMLCATIVSFSGSPAYSAPTATHVERVHNRAIVLFRGGRFPEAYGRFVDLANAGHPASAEYALWMCARGPALFGSEWDCSPQEVTAWAKIAGATGKKR